MSEISGILKSLTGTREEEILVQIENAYAKITDAQKIWYEKSEFLCPDGCGCCCHDFEPDLMQGEALYMAAWLLENQREKALQIADGKFPFENRKTCLLFDSENPYHCTIYGGRPFICRLFGASGAKSKDNKTVWKPCKFYPQEILSQFKTPLAHRQYSQEEILAVFGILPPVMSDFMEDSISVEAEVSETTVLREILPQTIRRLLWICSMNSENIPA